MRIFNRFAKRVVTEERRTEVTQPRLVAGVRQQDRYRPQLQPTVYLSSEVLSGFPRSFPDKWGTVLPRSA